MTILGLNDWVFWLVLAVVFIVVELMTVSMISIWFAGGAVSAFVVAVVSDNLILQMVFFFVISAVLLGAFIKFKPFSKSVGKDAVATNFDRIIGKNGIVIETIDLVEGKGMIKVMGQVWSAVSIDGTKIVEGSNVVVVNIEGVKALVRQI